MDENRELDPRYQYLKKICQFGYVKRGMSNDTKFSKAHFEELADAKFITQSLDLEVT